MKPLGRRLALGSFARADAAPCSPCCPALAVWPCPLPGTGRSIHVPKSPTRKPSCVVTEAPHTGKTGQKKTRGRKELSATVCDMDYPQSLDALPGSGQKADFSVPSIFGVTRQLTPSKIAEL